jgi:hypothetical protein
MSPSVDFQDLLDLAAALRAEEDQEEARLGSLLGLTRGVPRDASVVSPDVGMRLTRDGVIPARVKISWLLGRERSISSRKTDAARLLALAAIASPSWPSRSSACTAASLPCPRRSSR